MTPITVYFGLTFMTCLALGFSGIILIDRSRRVRRARLVRFSSDHPGRTSARVMRRLEATQTAEKDGLRHTKGGLIGLLEVRLKEAGLEISPMAAIGLMCAIAVVAGGGFWLSGLFPLPLAPVLGAGAGWVVFNVLLSAMRARRVRTFNEALPDCLDILARGLRAGQPIPAALAVVAQHARGIAQEEFRRCCEELKLGVPLIKALTGVAERIGSPEAHFVTVATSLQSETGGNLVETLENLAELLRDRKKLRRKAAALSAEIRVSALILSSLPFVVAVVLFFMNPGYLNPLITDARGQVMAAAALLSLGLGIYSMYKLSRIDV
ncbi:MULTISPECIES: type II secretion system F family protein [Roseobacteraceae]|uniref:Type II secretion system (T2SS), protein F n=1 Tax=Pseudosulfitobacter pseudonitzschiae TaxID=1402135 RepID=A0A221K7E3_9RHOB|nr:MULTISPECIES: type II secretion system F family protein [Roseobacteraceae]ASM74928.1 type II secretion system (T2SS), protein F [Pseudosulfitobacter pseudonitzschiae]